MKLINYDCDINIKLIHPEWHIIAKFLNSEYTIFIMYVIRITEGGEEVDSPFQTTSFSIYIKFSLDWVANCWKGLEGKVKTQKET